MATYYYNPPASTSSGYHHHYAPYPVSSAPSAMTSASSSSKRSRTSSSVAPSNFSDIYSRCYGAPPAKQARPALRTMNSAPPQLASTHRVYDKAQAPAAPVVTPPKMSSRSGSHTSLRAPRPSFDVRTASSKHVHFADQGAQRPPLKSHHTWSAGDRSAPAPVYAVALPERTTVPAAAPAIELHPLLSHSSKHRATISYDASLPPAIDSMLDRKTRAALPAQTLSAPATSPPTPTNQRLVLTCPKLPWPVVVQPSRSGGAAPRRTPITNLDVLAAVHASLSRPCSAAEWASLGAGSSAQRRVRRAFERRCTRSGGWEGGVRRIDWLGGKTRLVGVELEHGKGVSPGVTGTLVFASPKD